jgi:uncharacterized protein YaiL (DUF2058 family)
MSGSLRDQLLGLGFKPAPKPESKPAQKHPARSPSGKGSDTRHGHKAAGGDRGAGGRARQSPAAGKPRGEMDLAKAYAIRAQKEKDERIAAERARQEEAQRKREGKQKLTTLLAAASLNDPAAEVVRHFEYGGKIRRVYVNPDQLKALNAGELAVVQQGGRYHLVTAAHGREADALLPGVLALLADPGVASADDVYADPKYQVPDDLVW